MTWKITQEIQTGMTLQSLLAPQFHPLLCGFKTSFSSPLWTLSAIHAFPLLVHLSGRFTNEWTFHIPKLDATSVTLFLGWHQFSSPCLIFMKDFLLCLSVEFMVVCCYSSVPTPWHEITASESWVDVSEKSFKSSLLMNSKTICLFKTDSYFRFTRRTFWFEAKETLTQFFLLLRPYLKKKIPVFSAIYSCIFVIYRFEESSNTSNNRLKYT